MIQALYEYLNQHFNGLILRSPLFYNWKYGIRFEISHPCLSSDDPENMKQTFERAITLFHEVCEEQDELLIVTDVHAVKRDLLLQQQPLNVYLKYIKDKQKLYKLQHEQVRNLFEDEEEQLVTHRFVLPCRKSELKYAQLLQAISYEDFRHPSTILKNKPQHGYDIYFVNRSKKIIYHLYDDRGCDIVAGDKEALRFLYENYNAWILDYDRKEIDQLFQ
jgi:hypothetical protein